MVQRHRVLVGENEHPDDDDQGRDADTVDDQPAARRDLLGQLGGPPEHGHGRADQQAAGPGVGPFVRTGVVEAGRSDVPHQREGDGRQPEGDERDPAELALEQFEEKQQEKGPEQIELLLHRQGPEVIERSRTGESVEVGHAGRNRGPVRDIEQGSQCLARPGGQGTAVDDEGRDEDDEQHQDDGRQQAPGPSQPEVLEVKVSGAVPGRQQDGRDQVAAQGEEDPDPEQAARHPRSTEVVHDDRDHRNGTDTVESRQIRCFMANRAWHPCPCRRTGRSDGEVRTTLNAPLPVEQVRLPVEQVRRDHARGGAVQFGGFRRAERVASQARIHPGSKAAGREP